MNRNLDQSKYGLLPSPILELFAAMSLVLMVAMVSLLLGKQIFPFCKHLLEKQIFFNCKEHLKNVRAPLREMVVQFMQTNAGRCKLQGKGKGLVLSTLLGTFCHCQLSGGPGPAWPAIQSQRSFRYMLFTVPASFGEL